MSAGFDACPDHNIRLQRRGDGLFCPGPIGDGEHKVSHYLRALDGELVRADGKGEKAMPKKVLAPGRTAVSAARPPAARAKSEPLEHARLWDEDKAYLTFRLVRKATKNNLEDLYRVLWTSGQIGSKRPEHGTASTAPDEELGRKRYHQLVDEARAQGWKDRPRSNNGAPGRRVVLKAPPAPPKRKPRSR